MQITLTEKTPLKSRREKLDRFQASSFRGRQTKLLAVTAGACIRYVRIKDSI